ncbi:MAG: NifU N-terminal domain-containing protein [Planctomycetota bacterium]
MVRVIGFESTPNPNAIKIVLEGAIPAAPRSYRHPPTGAGLASADPLAAALFAIDGVRVVLIHEEFVSLCKAPAAAWKAIKPRARAAIEAHAGAAGEPADRDA